MILAMDQRLVRFLEMTSGLILFAGLAGLHWWIYTAFFKPRPRRARR